MDVGTINRVSMGSVTAFDPVAVVVIIAVDSAAVAVVAIGENRQRHGAQKQSQRKQDA